MRCFLTCLAGQLYYPYPPPGMDPSGMLRPPAMPMDPMMFQQPHQFLPNMQGAVLPASCWSSYCCAALAC